MTVLRTAVNTNSPEYIAAAEAMQTKLAEVNAETAKALCRRRAEIRCPSP